MPGMLRTKRVIVNSPLIDKKSHMAAPSQSKAFVEVGLRQLKMDTAYRRV